MQQYPKWKYHQTEEPEIVADADEEVALGAEWADSPALVGKAETCPQRHEKPKPWKKKKAEGKAE